jgi:hypothetical protein
MKIIITTTLLLTLSFVNCDRVIACTPEIINKCNVFINNVKNSKEINFGSYDGVTCNCSKKVYKFDLLEKCSLYTGSGEGFGDSCGFSLNEECKQMCKDIQTDSVNCDYYKGGMNCKQRIN